MNERIEEIAEQAGFSVGQIQAEVLCPDHDSPELFRIMDEFNKFPKEVRWHIQDVLESKMEKFAELLVKECMKVADEGMAQVTMRVEWPSYHIKKHFGVEE